jgi:hypothetical protein
VKDPGHLAQHELVLGLVLQVAEGVEQVEHGVEAAVGERQPGHVRLDQGQRLAGGGGPGDPGQQRAAPVEAGDPVAEPGQGDGVAAVPAAQVEQARSRGRPSSSTTPSTSAAVRSSSSSEAKMRR